MRSAFIAVEGRWAGEGQSETRQIQVRTDLIEAVEDRGSKGAEIRTFGGARYITAESFEFVMLTIAGA